MSRELYDEFEYFHNLQIKVYKIDYEPFADIYTVSFTSPFIKEIEDGTEYIEYIIIFSNGIYFEERGL